MVTFVTSISNLWGYLDNLCTLVTFTELSDTVTNLLNTDNNLQQLVDQLMDVDPELATQILTQLLNTTRLQVSKWGGGRRTFERLGREYLRNGVIRCTQLKQEQKFRLHEEREKQKKK